MPVHHLVNLGLSLGARALWRAHRERQQEVPYATMVTPASVVVAGDPGYQPAKPEPLPRCLCGAMTLKTGAIVIGALNIIASCLAALAIDIDMMMDSRFDPGVFFPVLLAASAYVSFNSLLIHGARTASHCLVLSWVVFQATATGLKSAGLLIVMLIFLQNSFYWRVTITITLVGGAILALQWCFFVVGLRLAKHLSRRKGTVLQINRLATSVALPAHQPQQSQFQPKQPQFQPQQPQFQTQQPQFQTQQPQFQPQQPQFQPQQPQFQPQQPQFQTQQPSQSQQPQFQPQQPQFQTQQPQFQPQQPQFQTQQPQFQPQQPQFQPQQPQFQPQQPSQSQQQDAPPPYSSSDLTSPIAPALQNGPSQVTKKESLQ